jgi:GNAT superfamily N-acetyltransferase
MGGIIYEDPSRGLTMRVDEGYSDAFVALLGRTVWGTEGLRYRNPDVRQELQRIPRFHMIRLLRGEALVGAYGLAEKVVSAGRVQVPALHRTYLAVDQRYQGQGYGKLLVTQVKRHFLDEADDPVMLYGYIEAENSRSLGPSRKAGYRPIGAFESVLFSRFRPRPHPAIERPGDEGEVRALLEEEYAGFALCDLDHSLIRSEYYVLRRGRTIVAGLQAHRVRYEVVSLAGWYGRLVLRAMPRTPYLRRLLPGGVLDYVSVSNIHCPAGYEGDFLALLEGVLAANDLHVAIALLDRTSPVLARLRATGKLGVLSRLGVNSLAYVMAGFHQVAEEVVDAFVERPLLISPLDPI